MSPEWPRPAHALLLIPLVVALAWVVERGKSTTEDPSTVLRALRASHGAVLPAAGAAGASKRSEPSRYDRDTLFDLIDGAADTYLARGFVEARAAVYEFARPTGPPLEISAELHRFGSAGGAVEQRDAEKPGSAREVPGLPGAVWDGSVLMLLSGSDLLKLTALTPDPAAPAGLLGVARAFDRERNPDKERPR